MAKRTVDDATRMAIHAEARIPSITAYDTQINDIDVGDAFAPVDSGQQYPSTTNQQPPLGHIWVKGFDFHIEEYLEQGWVKKFIIPLDKIESMPVPNSIRMRLHPWQLSGAAKMDYLCRSSFGGGMCGDAPGMGKTALTILAMDLAAKEHGSFSLVVCPSPYKRQWEIEILAAYHEGYQPRVLVLEGNTKTAHELIDERWDVIIVSYQFILAQHHAVKNFRKNLESYHNGESVKPKLPVTSLISQAWRDLNLPVKRLVLDEAHMLKRDNGANYNAIKEIYTTATIMLSGTVLHNRWTDVGNLLGLLHGHPWSTKSKFVQDFSVPHEPISRLNPVPDVTSVARLLLAVMFARPSTCLNLPGLSCENANFNLNDIEARHVKNATDNYERTRIKFLEENSGSGHGNSAVALGLAVKAQLHSLHHHLTERVDTSPGPNERGHDVSENEDQFMFNLGAMQESESSDTRSCWLEELRHLDTQSLKNSSRTQAVLELIQGVRSQRPTEKIVVFSSYLRYLDILYEVIKRDFKIDCLRFDGTMSRSQKDKVREAFKCTTSPPIMLITSGAGGVGLNLQSASVVIQSEVWWNHNNELQAWARAHRFGQSKEVTVYRLMGENSAIDNKFLETQMRKTKVNNSIMDIIVRDDDAPISIPPYQTDVW